MQLFRDYHRIKLSASVVTIGNFDGLHVGHQALIQETLRLALQSQLPSVLLTFEPLPLTYFNPDTLYRMMPLRTKYRLLSQSPIDYLGLLRFNAALACLPAEDFVKQCLVDALGVKTLVVGEDFRFGFQKQGNVALLQSLGKQYGFDVVVTANILMQGERVSSSKIRQALTMGDIAKVNAMLGYAFSLIARVKKGKQLGRTLGFPTANLAIAPKFILINGVYICYLIVNGKRHQAVCNVGYQPTVKRYHKKVEVHVLEFEGSLYGQEVRVEFLEKIRNEKKFANIPELIENIKHDTLTAKRYFAAREGTLIS